MILPNLHRIAKVTLSFVLAFMLFIRLFIVDVSALSAAPIFGEALVEVFSGLLVGSGLYTADEVNNMTWEEAETSIEQGISSGVINPLDVVGDVTVNGVTKKMNFLEWLSTVSATAGATADAVVSSDTFGTVTDTSLKMTLKNYVPVTIGNWVTTSVDKDDVIDTPATDMNGYGCKIVYVDGKTTHNIYCSYSVLDDYYDVYSIYGSGFIETIDKYGNITYTHFYENGSSPSYGGTFANSKSSIYGDVRTKSGDEAETDDTYTDVIGENADGDLISLEDLQSGAIPLDDTLLDYDNFTDESVIELLQQILAELEQVPVVEDEKDNTIAEDFADNLDGSVALELEDINALTLPTGIATVFPFCLPFDFAYGLELLAAKPVAPKFEIPFEIPAFGLYPGTKDVITLDMKQYSKYFEVGRWVQIVIFSIGLCFISFKVVKGVH